MSDNQDSICPCPPQFFTLVYDYILVVQKFIFWEQLIFKGVGGSGGLDCAQADHSDANAALELIHLRYLLARQEL